MNPTDHPSTPEDVARRVREWLRQFHTMLGLDSEVIHRANLAPLNVSDLQALIGLGDVLEDVRYELGQRKADCQKVRDELLPVLAKHPLTKDDVDVTESGTVRAGYVAKLARQVIEHQRLENMNEIQISNGALQSLRIAYAQMEVERDELRLTIAKAAGIDLEKVSEIDVDFVHEARELVTEVRRLEGNEDFTTRVLHAVMGCCDGRESYDSCEFRAVEDAFDTFRRGEMPQIDTTVDVRTVLASRARQYAEQRNAESGGEHDIDDAYWDDMAEFQAKGLRLAQGAAQRDLVFALRRQIRAWRAEKRTGKELGTPNEIAHDDGYAGGRVDAAHELEYLIDQANKVGKR